MPESAWEELQEPFEITVYDRGLKKRFPLKLGGGPGMTGLTKVRVSLGVGEVGVATIEMPLAHPRAYDLQARGTRVRISHRLAGHVLSGPIWSYKASRGAGNREGSTVTFTIKDDLQLLWSVLGWVAPTKGIDQQQSDNSDAVYRISDKPAEYIVKRAFTDNVVNRLGIPVVVAPDQGRGAVTSYWTRNHTLAAKFFPAITQAGLGVTIAQVDDPDSLHQAVRLDVHEFPTHREVITPDSPQVVDWTVEATGPEALYGVVGGSGQGNQRVFRAGKSSEAGDWGPYWGGEIFEDQRRESLPASLDRALAEEFADKGSKAQIDLVLNGIDRWAYGRSWVLGDFITWRTHRYASEITTQITSAELTWSPKEQFRASATTGAAGKREVERQIRRLTQQVQDLRAGW